MIDHVAVDIKGRVAHRSREVISIYGGAASVKRFRLESTYSYPEACQCWGK